MSRVGQKPIEIPQGVEVKIEGAKVAVKGPKGELTRKFSKDLGISVKDNRIYLERFSDNKFYRSLHGLTRTLIANMIEGVSKGFSKTLEITGVGFRATKKGDNLEIQVGYSHNIIFPKHQGIQIEVPTATKIIISGIDKELVGEVAASIRRIRKPEPYKGKGIKYEGEYVRRKVGKTAK